MTDADKQNFLMLISGVHSFYRQQMSEFSGGVWWMAMKPFDLAAVHDAFNRHCVNPDNGQFMPKPADIVKLLSGSSQDKALVAWSQVDSTIRRVGTYQTVVFDDPIVHRVVLDMGGWIALGSKQDTEWPFVGKEFENRYRGYLNQGGVSEYPPKLIGIAEAQNTQNGFKSQPPVLIGDQIKAKRVLLNGVEKPMLGIERMSEQDYAVIAANMRKPHEALRLGSTENRNSQQNRASLRESPIGTPSRGTYPMAQV